MAKANANETTNATETNASNVVELFPLAAPESVTADDIARETQKLGGIKEVKLVKAYKVGDKWTDRPDDEDVKAWTHFQFRLVDGAKRDKAVKGVEREPLHIATVLTVSREEFENLPKELLIHLAAHGLSQKVGDTVAGKGDHAADKLSFLRAAFKAVMVEHSWREAAQPRVAPAEGLTIDQRIEVVVKAFEAGGKPVPPQDAIRAKVSDNATWLGEKRNGLAYAPEIAAQINLLIAQLRAEKVSNKDGGEDLFAAFE